MPTQLVRRSSDWLVGWLLRGWGRGKGLYPPWGEQAGGACSAGFPRSLRMVSLLTLTSSALKQLVNKP